MEVGGAFSLPHYIPPVAVAPQCYTSKQAVPSEAPQYLLDPQKL